MQDNNPSPKPQPTDREGLASVAPPQSPLSDPLATENSSTPHAPNSDFSSFSSGSSQSEPAAAWAKTEPTVVLSSPGTSDDLQIPAAQSTGPTLSAASAQASPDQPIGVIEVLSVRGVEYGMMTISLWIAATTLASIMFAFVAGGVDYAALTLPAALLLVTMPIFALFFLRLKKAELANPAIKLDASRRRWGQVTQIYTFLACLFALVAGVYAIMASVAGAESLPIGKTLLDVLIVLIIAGGILAYYWFDEHNKLGSTR